MAPQCPHVFQAAAVSPLAQGNPHSAALAVAAAAAGDSRAAVRWRLRSWRQNVARRW